MNQLARLLAVTVTLLGISIPLIGQDKEPEKSDFFRGRLPEARKKLLREGGGSALSEKAVADGLRWLALHQAQDGHWGLHNFNKHVREKPWPDGKVAEDDSTPGTTQDNDVAATAFALLPFLAAGITPKTQPAADREGYRKGVEAGLQWLMKQQSTAKDARGTFGIGTYTYGVGTNVKRGSYGKGMYAHALATTALCEAYALTRDARIKASAQMALDFIISAQDQDGGGWRYVPRQAGDVSVTGFQLITLVIGRMAGLKVPRQVLSKANKFLDSCESGHEGGYSYRPGGGATIAMSAVGALCRLSLGVAPCNLSVRASVQRIRHYPPGSIDNIYYEYYATQVIHYVGGDDWTFWNLGPKGTEKGGIRDGLIAKQDDGKEKNGNKGSWAGTAHVGGRLGATAFSLLTLQVYYRYQTAIRLPIPVPKE
jgi:hypothetical protein